MLFGKTQPCEMSNLDIERICMFFAKNRDWSDELFDIPEYLKKLGEIQ